MSAGPTNDELRKLADDYFLRELTAEELALLEGALAADGEFRKHFAGTVRDEWCLQAVHQEEGEEVIPFSREERSPRIPRLVALAACVAALLTLGMLVLPRMAKDDGAVAVNPSEEPVATVSELFVLGGDVVTLVNAGKSRTLEIGTQLRSGDRIETPAASRLAFRYDNEETSIRLTGESSLELSDDNGAKRLHLRNGSLVADVDTQPEGEPMRVRTNDAEAVVLGTAFEVLARDNTRLAVNHGKVEFGPIDSRSHVVVDGGFISEASPLGDWSVEPFRAHSFSPVFDTTLNQPDEVEYLTIDPARDFASFLAFDLGKIHGEIREAKLRLRVMTKDTDRGGEGTVRLFRTEPRSSWVEEAPSRKEPLSVYQGKLGAGMDLVIDIRPDQITDGILPLLLTLDSNGNDFWFSSSEGPISPELTLKVVTSDFQ